MVIFFVLFACSPTAVEETTVEEVVVEVEEETSASAPTPTVSSLPVARTVEPMVEVLAYESLAAQSLSGHTFLVQNGTQIEYIDETQSGSIVLSDASVFGGASLDAENTLLAFDGELKTFDGQWLLSSPLNDIVPVPVEHIQRDSHGLWLQGAGHLYRYVDSSLQALSVGDEEVRLFATASNGMIALAAPDLILVDALSEPPIVREHVFDIAAKRIAFDSRGGFWVSDGSEILHHRSPEGVWSGLIASSPILEVFSNAKTADLWIKMEEGALHHRDGVFSSVSIPEGVWQSIDEYGRLLIVGETELQRISIERRVVVAGLEMHGTLEAPTEIAYLPTDPETVQSLQAWVDQEPLSIEAESWRSNLDPNNYDVGAHLLRITTVGPEGSRITEVPFVIGSLPETKWVGELDILMEDNCLQCHGEASFMPLYEAEQWREHIDLIIAEVVTNSMPLGGPYLSEGEIQMIRGWKNGGFQ